MYLPPDLVCVTESIKYFPSNFPNPTKLKQSAATYFALPTIFKVIVVDSLIFLLNAAFALISASLYVSAFDDINICLFPDVPGIVYT